MTSNELTQLGNDQLLEVFIEMIARRSDGKLKTAASIRNAEEVERLCQEVLRRMKTNSSTP